MPDQGDAPFVDAGERAGDFVVARWQIDDFFLPHIGAQQVQRRLDRRGVIGDTVAFRGRRHIRLHVDPIRTRLPIQQRNMHRSVKRIPA